MGFLKKLVKSAIPGGSAKKLLNPVSATKMAVNPVTATKATLGVSKPKATPARRVGR